MLTWENASDKSGPVSLISQSGGNAQDFSNYLTDHYKFISANPSVTAML